MTPFDTPAAGADVFPVSFTQQRLWFLDRMEGGSAAYGVTGALRLKGALEVEALRRALEALVERHESLRTTFAVEAGEPVQVIHPPAPFELAVEDFDASAEGVLRARLDAEARRRFDLDAGPLFRALLLRTGADEHVLVIAMHHIVSDGWSLGVFFRELSALYSAFRRGDEPALPELALQYADYAVWQRETLAGEALERHLAWWRESLGGAPTLLELPTDRPRPASLSHRGARTRVRLGAGTVEPLRALAREEGATLFMVMLSAWQLLLSKYSGQDDVVVGTSIAGRTRAELEGVVGFFANTLALRGDASGDPSFRGFLRRVRETTFGAFAHQEVPFEKLVEELKVPRALGYNPLFQAFIALQNAGDEGLKLDGLEVSALEVESGTAKFDLSLLLREADGAVEGWLEYADELFDAATMRRMAGHLAVLAGEIAAAPDRRLSELTLLDADERAKVLEEWNPAPSPFAVDTLHRRFEARAAEAPSSVAVTYEHESLSYGELNARANRLARHLQSLGAGPESRVGLCVERGIEMVVGVLGVLKAGGAYVPLDPTYPEDRLAYMVEDAGISVLVTHSALGDRVAGDVARVALDGDAEAIARHGDENLDVAVSPDALAYVIYTSGSTGRPKGAMLTHANVARLFTATEAWFDFGASDVWTMFHSYAFDFSVWEIWGALLYGGRLVVVPFLTSRSPEQFRALLRDEGVTVLNQTPSAFQQLIQADAAEPEQLDRLRCVVFGGEALQFASLRPWLDRYGLAQPRLVNMYGITETCVHVTYHPVTGRDLRDPSGASVIGRQIPDLRLYVLDAAMRPLPAGVPGELFVGGAGLARGYLRRPALTSERFVPDPFSSEPGARLYRSGDRARWKADGKLEYLGRIDFQVKVRGFRIELGEIEAALLAHPQVRECAVLVRDDAGDAQIVAYVVPSHGQPAAAELREAARKRLPDYMVPGAFVVLDALPLTGNGKLDRRALPAPDAARAGGDAFTGPRTPVEEVLAAVWAEVLGIDRIGVDDDFFALGGHSLRATQVTSRVREALGVDVPLRSLFENPTLGALAEAVEKLGPSVAAKAAPPVEAAPEDGAPVPLSFSQQRLWFLDQMKPGGHAYNVASALRLAGPLDVPALERAFGEIVHRHGALRTTFAESAGGPVQVVHPPTPFTLEVVEAGEGEVAARAAETAWAPFDLTAGPLFRARLVRVDARDHVLVTVAHHSVFDGWSGSLVFSELSALYAAFTQGRPSPLAPLALQFTDHALWQRDWLTGQVLEEQLAHWRRHLDGVPVLDLPTDRPRAAVQRHRGAVHRFRLPARLSDELHALARREGATPFMVLLAAYQALLGRWSGQDDVVVGTPIANRTRREMEAVVGFFANTLALRADLSGDPTFRALLARVRDETLEAHAHQDFPFDKLVDELRIERDMSRGPLVQVMFVYNAGATAPPALEGLETAPFRLDVDSAKMDLMLTMYEAGDELGGTLEYDRDLFEAATIERFGDALQVLLAGIAAAPGERLSRLPVLESAERARVLEAWNAPSGDFVVEPLHRRFEARAAEAPSSAAVTYEGESLSYGELNARANRLARHLQSLGAGPESRVGLCVERGMEMVVGILGILKAGGAYVPLDPTYPEDRLAYMVEDAGISVLVTHSALGDRVAGEGIARVAIDGDADAIAQHGDGSLDVDVGLDALAYVIYTSGSTGRPKGAMLTHANVARLFTATDAWFDFGASDVWTMFHSYAFDFSVWEIWGALLYGGRLVVVPFLTSRSPEQFRALLRDEGVTVLNQTPSAFQQLIQADAAEPEPLTKLRCVVFGGEALQFASLRPWLDRYGLAQPRLVNMYGITETCVHVTYHPVTGRDLRDPSGASIIGERIPDLRLHVLDAALQPVPLGVPGELFVGGAGLARGYLGRPALTAERFIPDPYATEPGARLYRSGDRARRKADGKLEYLGRIDFQVKVRGFRIELGEIEAALLAHPRVRECAVLVRDDDGDQRIVAYVVGHDGAAPAARELRDALKERLPEYMVPGAFVVLDAFPINANGKLDRRALPAPDASRGDAGAGDYLAPRTPVEEVLAELWADVLGVARVGVDDDFFAHGGHSLSATRVVARTQEALGVAVPLRVLFETPTVAGLAAAVERARAAGGGAHGAPPILPGTAGETAPLTFAQQRLWFLERMAPGSVAYVIPTGLRLAGALDAAALERALAELVRRHDALGSIVTVRDGEPVQTAGPAESFALAVEDLRHVPTDTREAELERRARAEAWRPFDLARGPLFRATLYRVDEGDHVLVIGQHHAVSDGLSNRILLGELAALYGAFARGEPSPLSEPTVRYADYATWQRDWLRGAVLEAQLAFWRAHLEGVPVLDLPTDRPRPAVQRNRGALLRFRLDEELTRGVRALARREGATPYMLLLAAFQALLARWSGQDDVVVGTPIANRNRPEVEKVVGLFANMLAVRARLDDDPTFRDFLRRVREETLDAHAHQDVPFEKLVEELRVERDLSRSPLVQVMFSWHGGEDAPPAFAGMEAAPFRLEGDSCKFDLLLAMSEGESGMAGALEYDRDLFEAATIERFAEALRVLLAGIVAAPDARVSRLPVLEEIERARVLEAWNPPAEAFAIEPLHRRFEARAAEAPSAVAVTYERESLAYGELNARANRLARHLQSLGVGPESRVGLCVERGMEMVVAILGILKAGGAYVPLDPTYPEDRLAYMVGDAGISVLVTQAALADRVAGDVARVALDGDAAMIAALDGGDLDVEVSPDALAYVIYTSGSTGRPKGAMLTHANVARLFTATDAWFEFGPADVWTMFHSYAFDFSVWEIWGALLYGGRLVVVPFLVSRSPEQFRALLRDEGVTILNQTPSAFQQLIQADAKEAEPLTALRRVVFGGEALQFASLRPWLDRYGPAQPRLVNMYGITETCVHVTHYPVTGRELRDPAAGSVIGRQILDLRLHVLDAALQPVPLGVPGELFVGGAGLARGYLGRPALTAERFVPDPYATEPGARLYRSGDRARRKADGALEYLGRIDFQVKVRGFRIELGEIEAALLAHPRVRECAAVVRDDEGEKRIVAYVVGHDGAAPAARELRDAVKDRLPDYMVPAAIVALDALPINANGKLDRRALPAPEAARDDEGGAYVAPRTPVEEVLAQLWADVLGVERVGVDDDFFALGGHSLSATRVAARVEEALGVALPLRVFFETPTVAGAARTFERILHAGEDAAAPLRPSGLEAPPLSFAQRRLWFLERMEPGTGTYNIPTALRLSGTLDADALRRALAEVARRHEVLRARVDVVDDEPVQRLVPADRFEVPVEAVAAASLEARLADEAWLPFDLERGLLFRARLFRLAPDEHVLLLVSHHIVSDGWSFGVLLGELSALYAAFARGEASPLPDLAVQYGDYAAWQREHLSGEVLERQLAWWKGRLAGAPALLELPTDHPRSALRGSEAADSRFELTPALTAALRDLSRREGTTLFMTLLAGWQALLGRYAGQDDVVVGTPIAGRTRAEVEGLIGCFVNTLALRGDLSGDPAFATLLKRVREEMLGAHAHQDLPFEKLVEELAPRRSLHHTPLFQVMFTLQQPERAPRLGGLAVEMVRTGVETAKFDLVLTVLDDGERLRGRLSYRAGLFEAETARRMTEHFGVLLEAAGAAPHLPVSRLPILSATERAKVVAEWNATERPLSLVPVHQRFEAQALKTPHAAAVRFGAETVSYAELERRANRVARHLRARGVRTDDRVGLLLERGVDLPAAVLGILKAGAAYVALDPGAPDERLRFLLRDAGASAVVTRGALASRVDGFAGAAVRLDADAAAIEAESGESPGVSVSPENLAYVVYTSGSTGAPKGVLVEHGGLANYLAWFEETVLGDEGFALPLVSRLSFDAHARQLFPPLLRGEAVWVLPEETASDAAALLAELRAGQRVSFGGVPSLWGAVVERIRAGDAPPAGLKAVLLGGEPLPPALLERTRELFPGVPVWNHYGPTEATVNTSVARVEDGRVTIGRPIANVRVYLLDEGGTPVPVGVPGELYVAGAGVARGYLGRPEMTAEKFVPDPFSAAPGARMYRSGDRARWLSDGALEYLGRGDGQVKVRGFRIELGEIETVLARHPAVREAAVAARADDGGEARLVAYVAARGEAPSTTELKAHLGATLPDYMVPAAFVFLARLPKGGTGKIDRRALPAPAPAETPVDDGGYAGPRTEVEEALAGIFAEVLALPRVGVDDDFFELGGHSLRAMQVAARVREALRVTVPLRSLFESPTVAGLAEHVERLLHEDDGGDASPPLARGGDDGETPLSFAQRRLWILEKMEPGTAIYNMPSALRLEGALEVDALRRALSEIVRRHQVLRTTFVEVDGEPVGHVAPAALLPFPVEDVAGEEEMRRRVMEEAERPFDLERGPLFRALLFRLSEREHVLLVSMHHVVSDGWSTGVLLRELTALYGAFSRGEPSPLPELPAQYADFAARQAEYLTGAVLERQLGWWKERLAGAPAVLELPTDRPRPARRSTAGGFERFDLTPALAASLRDLSRREGATLFMTLLAGWQALLAKVSGQDDMVVGTPIAGRTQRDVEGLIGFFVNTLALRGDLTGDPTFRQLLARVRETTLGAYAHQDLPFERLVEEVAPARSLAHTPVFQAAFALDNTPERSLRLGEVKISIVASAPEVAKFDLSLLMRDSGVALGGSLGYSRDLYDADTVRRMARHLGVLLAAAAANPDLPLSALPLADAEEAEALRALSARPSDAPSHRCAHHLFEEQARRTPSATALVFRDEKVTYAELDARANRLAHHLRRRGVGPDVKVGFCMERSPEMVVALLGILKAGGAYVPIDPGYPEERIAFMVREIGAPLLLTQERVLPRLPAGANALALDAAWAEVEREPSTPPQVDVTPDHLVYVLYTSGSTGTPKGSEVPHRAIPGFFWNAEYVTYDAEQVLLHYSSSSWDVLTLELFPALLTGGTSVLYPGQTPELDGMLDEVRRNGVTTLWFSAAFFNLVVDTRPELLAGVRQVLVGGEAVSVPHVRRALELYPELRLVNGYGPSECTVFTTCHPIPRGFEGAAVPIGAPVGDRRAYVLDRSLRPVPVGVPGELYVGGPAVPRGYHARPGLTAATLVPDPFGEPGARLYRTGDRVRWRADGTLEYLGRIDQQVKVRGFRIELEEVEAVLLQDPAVREAVAIVREDVPGDRRLVAYAVPADAARPPTPAELREHLRARLPDYMLPSACVVLEALPLNANRKVDRRALPAPEGVAEEETFVAPRTPAEETLAAIFAEILGRQRVGVHDDFFACGGHSLKAARVVSRAQEAFSVKVPLRALFERPTVAGLAEEVERLLVQDSTVKVSRIAPVSRQARRAALADLTHGE